MNRSEQLYFTVIDAVYEHSVNKAEEMAFGCVSSEGKLESALTYRELVRRSESVAAELLRFCETGDRAVLLFHGGEEFVVSFLGCLMAGVIAVPGYPVRVPASAALPARNYERLIPIIANAEPKVVLTTEPVRNRRTELSAAEPVFSGLEWIAVEQIQDRRLESRPKPHGGDLAFLQYTSGSTSIPKGVMVSHDNLVSVFKDMDASWPHDESSVMVTWAPVYHDMGLIHGVLFPLYFGFPVYSLMAASVLQQPKRWLQAVTQFGGTHSAGPNFILDLCLKRISDADKKELDLSSLRSCLTGAEAVRHKTLDRFRKAFAPCGLRPDAIQPGYGLAEFTLTVSGVDIGRIPRTARLNAAACERGRVVFADGEEGRLTRSFVSCGWTHVGSDIRIVDPESYRECQPDEIGEIWVRGSNLAQGYWKNPEATEAAMGARMADGRGPFLRTGDLGFIIDREIYVADRLKDLIIIRGRNLYPHDIETTIEETLPEARTGRTCAFSMEREQGEALVVIVELDRARRNNFDADEVFGRLNEAICFQHDVELYDAVLVRTGSFPLTSSGKVQRRRARQEYVEGALQVVARMREPNSSSSPNNLFKHRLDEVRSWLIGYLAGKLRRPSEKIPSDQPFERLGLDSLSLVEMVLELEESTGRTLDPKIVFDYPSVEMLSAEVARQQLISLKAAAAAAD